MNKSQQRCSPLFVINIKQMLKQTYRNNNKHKIHISNNVTQPFLRMSLSQRSQRSYRKENYLIKKAVNSNNNTTRSTLYKGNDININHKTNQSTILNSSKSNNNTSLGEDKSFNINNSSKINKCNVFRTNMKGNVIQDLINVTNNREKCLHNSNKTCASVENKSNKSTFYPNRVNIKTKVKDIHVDTLKKALFGNLRNKSNKQNDLNKYLYSCPNTPIKTNIMAYYIGKKKRKNI
jgi:hypothetical protein